MFKVFAPISFEHKDSPITENAWFAFPFCVSRPLLWDIKPHGNKKGRCFCDYIQSSPNYSSVLEQSRICHNSSCNLRCVYSSLSEIDSKI